MKNNKPRSREHRTKPMTAGATKMVKVHLPQSAFDQFKELFSKEEIFLCGLQNCLKQ